MTRRSFMQTGLGAAALGIPRRIRASEIYSSSDGQLAIGLEATQEFRRIGGNSVQVLTYNGLMPGPALELRPGDTMRIQFKNSLPETTNLHFHGLHTSPVGNGDNPFVMVAPGQVFDYEIKIPIDHPAGTFWYHPHLHGSTARQVFGGLSGVIIIRGELDAIPEIASAGETVLVLKDFNFDTSGRVLDAGMMARIDGREGQVITVNGETPASLRIQQNGLLRCRVLNASASRYYRLRIDEHPIGLIASDGGALPAVDWRDDVLIVPGQRVEFIIQGNRPPGEYRILSLPYNRGIANVGLGQSTNANLVLGQLTYSDTAGQSLQVPDSLLPVEPLPVPILPVRTLELSEGMMSFQINGRSFDANRIDTFVQLNTVEDWDLINRGQMDHPFHLHTNPFQRVAADGRAEPAWRDVVNVPRGGRQRIRTRFADFTGKTVYHCHILDHEDLGMMGTLEIRD